MSFFARVLECCDPGRLLEAVDSTHEYGSYDAVVYSHSEPPMACTRVLVALCLNLGLYIGLYIYVYASPAP